MAKTSMHLLNEQRCSQMDFPILQWPASKRYNLRKGTEPHTTNKP